jgi:Flp pilus assembly protein TadG
MKTKTSLARNERGQSLVEFAISLTAILILLAGAVDFGIGLFHYIAMRDAAQEGALFGAMNPPNAPTGGTYTCPAAQITNICARIQNSAGGTGLIANIFNDLTVTVAAQPACEGNAITVTLVYDYPISMPFIGGFIGSDHIRLRATVTDTVLTPVCP